MTGREADFLRAILDLAHQLGWLAAHHPDSRRLVGDAGLPDLVLAKPGHDPWLWELKTDAGRVSRKQRDWVYAIGPRALVVRPKDLRSGMVAAMLQEARIR